MNELSIQLHEQQTQHQQESSLMKQSYDDVFHRLEQELEAKKELSGEL